MDSADAGIKVCGSSTSPAGRQGLRRPGLRSQQLMTSHQQSVISYSHSWPLILQHDVFSIYTGYKFVQKPTLVAAFALLQEDCTSVEMQA